MSKRIKFKALFLFAAVASIVLYALLFGAPSIVVGAVMLVAGIAGAETGPIDGPIAIGGCVLGGLGGLGTYLTGLWANNAFGGAG